MEEEKGHPSSLRCSACIGTSEIVMPSPIVITDHESGEIICSNCGLVISNNIEDNAGLEWRSFAEGRAGVRGEGNTNRSRTGNPMSLARHDRGLATVIGRTDRDASGNKIDASVRSKMERLRIWDSRTHSYGSTNKNLIEAFSELDRLKDKLGLQYAVIERTAYIYRKAQHRGIVKGRTISSILTAALYIACRGLGVPKTLKEIAAISGVRLKILSRSYRILVTELNISSPPVIDPIKCIVKVANRADLTENTQRQAMRVMNNLTEKEISAGKNPMGLAATVLYITCLETGENKTQGDIANAGGVTEVTLRNRFKDLKAKLPCLI
jgi:transcription initiation factor TFIIB